MCMEFEMKSESSVVNEGCKKQQQQNQQKPTKNTHQEVTGSLIFFIP